MLKKSLLLIILNGLFASCVESLHIGNFSTVGQKRFTQNDDRSGGFPKFPQGFITSGDFVGGISGSIDNKFYYPFFITQKNQESKTGLNSCGTRSIKFTPKRNGKIIGGNIAPYGAFPWQVEIQIFNYEKGIFEHHCGAAVIGERTVLTAAHCTEISQQPYLHLVTGNYDLKKIDMYERRFRIDTIVMHPEFRRNGPYSNDISIIKVASNNDAGISFNSHVKPICLPKFDEISRPGTYCSVTGWGAQIPEDNKSLAPVLRVASVPLLDMQTCRMSDVNGGRSQSILDTMICAGLLQGGVDACSGDSGGPLACEYNMYGRQDPKFYLVGLVSWGDGCAKRNRPGVYTRVDQYIDWIEETMSNLDAY